ncbi:unnamed protein product [Allacma fusca]|uniref:Uncharacterized protein n=1 Tax=Allacma fusca TaxID=39272 RepID=A0A8J2JWN0_9HEXA|nr:unnamed protein product [Allacma fusca]
MTITTCSSFVLNADVSVPGEFFWVTEEQASSQMNVNFWGAVNTAEAFHSKLLEHKSNDTHIFNTSKILFRKF